MTYDVAIVGLGAMGSMAAWHLARRGLKVVGFDRFRPPHTMGSSHGLSRIIREAYAEGPQYVPLVQRAYEHWAELERLSGRCLLVRTGGLMIGPPDSRIVAGARRSATLHGVKVESLSAAEVRARFPVFALPPGSVALLESRAGILNPELAVQTALEQARQGGAELHFEEPVERWAAGSRITVETGAAGYEAERLILCAGAWMAKGLPRLQLQLQVARQLLFWFTPLRDAELFAPERCPVFLWEWAPGRNIYGFPDQGMGVKVAIHHEGPPVDPDAIDRTVAPGEDAELRGILEGHIPSAAGPVAHSAVCMYTNTEDWHFVLDLHPDDRRVVVASPCSGHGFKFAPAIGEILADLALHGGSRFDLAPFALARAALA